MHHSLVFFTVIAQAAAGAYMIGEILSFASGKPSITVSRKGFYLMVFIMLLAAISVAFLHLGRPARAVYALNNLRGSWLSREVLALSAFMFFNLVLVLLYGTPVTNPAISVVMRVGGFLSAAAMAFSMTRLYMVPSVISWNSLNTPVTFTLTALTAGSSLLLTTDYDTLIRSRSFRILLIVLTCLSAISSSAYLSPESGLMILLFLFRILLLLSLLVVLIRKNLQLIPNKKSLSVVIIPVIILASEAAGRYIFFLSFEKSGL